MTVDLRAKLGSISVAGLDVSPLFRSLVVRANQWDMSGRCSFTGSLVLEAETDGFAESTNPRINPTRWAPGNLVAASVTIGGTSYDLPFRLRILKPPSPPHPGKPELEIQVGDDLALLNYRAPEGDDSGVTLGTETSRDAIINNLLTTAGAPALIDSIPEHPVDCPQQKLDTRGYVSFAGVFAFGANKILWQQTDGSIRAQSMALDGLSAIAAYAVGTNEADYFPIDNDEGPPAVLKVVGEACNAATNSDLERTTSTTYAPKTQVFPDGGGGGNIRSEEISIETIGKATATSRVIEGKRQPLGLLMPTAYPNNTQLRLALETTTRRFFDSTGRLSREVLEYRALEGVTLAGDPDFEGSTGEFASGEETRNYSYNADDTIRKITTIIKEPAVLVDPEEYANSSDGVKKQLIQAERTEETWIKVGSSTNYLYTKQVNDYRTDSDNPSTGSSLYSNSGQAQPPATEWQEDEFNEEPIQVEGEARFEPLYGDDYREEPDPITLEAGAVSNEQCAEIASLVGRIKHGRQFGITWAAELTADWFTNFNPFRRVDFTLDGLTTAYLTDGLVFAFEPRSCSVGGDGIEIGQVSAAGVSPPYQELRQLRGGFRLGGILSWETYSTLAIEHNLLGGFRLGGILQALEGVEVGAEICYPDITQAQYFSLTQAQWFGLQQGCIGGGSTALLSWPDLTQEQYFSISQEDWMEVNQ